jgi:hypothetical protein
MKYFYETTAIKPFECDICGSIVKIGESRHRHKRNGTYKDDRNICDTCHGFLFDAEWIDPNTKNKNMKAFLKKAKKIEEKLK